MKEELSDLVNVYRAMIEASKAKTEVKVEVEDEEDTPVDTDGDEPKPKEKVTADPAANGPATKKDEEEDEEDTKNEGADKDTKNDGPAYKKFFAAALKKFGVKSQGELSGDDEKKFYDYVDANWKGDDEKSEMKESKFLGLLSKSDK